jgi:hypothetical protein
MKQIEEFDSILDEALEAYREAEPLAGLEERVLYRAQQRNRRRAVWLTWSLATGLITAGLAVAAWFVLRDPPYRPLVEETRIVRPAVQNAPAPSLPALDWAEVWRSANSDHGYPETPPPETFTARCRCSGKQSTAAQARIFAQEQFPAPTPMTPDERSLLTLANRDPQALRNLPLLDTEVAIAPIDIKPLGEHETGGEGDN